MNPQNLPSQDPHPFIPTNRYFSPLKERYRRNYCERKSIIRKYYGRKVIFVGRKTHFTAAMNRCKYFLHFKIDSEAISSRFFKSLANLIIFNTDIIFKGYWKFPSKWACFFKPNIQPLLLKKALRSCKNPQAFSPQPKHLQHLFHLKSLTLYVTNGSSMSKASKAITKLRFLQTLHVKYLSDYHKYDRNLPIQRKGKLTISNPDDKKGWGFFYKISKLPRLQTLHIKTSLSTLQGQSSAVQQDFADFYSASYRFKIDTEVYANSSLDIKELTARNMTSILKTADSLSIHLGIPKAPKKNPYICQENSQILKQGERPMKLYVLYKEKLQVNIGCLLTKCENLVSLYLKISGMEVFWDQDYGNSPIELQTVILDLDSLGLKYEILSDRRPSRFQIEEKVHEVSSERKVKFHSGLLELLKQLKTRAAGLETFTILMCLENFKKSWLQPKDFKDLYEKMVEEKARKFFEEPESFEKFHRIDLCSKPGDLDECLNRTLAAKSLKTVDVRSCCHSL